MQIVSIAFADADQTAIVVETPEQRLFAPWPINTWHRAIIEAWLAEGNAIQPYEEPPEPVPFDVSKLQLVRVMRDMPYGQGTVWDAFKFHLSQDPLAQEDWDLANRIERNHPMTPMLGVAFNLDDAALDALFRAAAAR